MEIKDEDINEVIPHWINGSFPLPVLELHLLSAVKLQYMGNSLTLSILEEHFHILKMLVSVRTDVLV
jgi:hypothetical protein